jgi:hypothetical protein
LSFKTNRRTGGIFLTDDRGQHITNPSNQKLADLLTRHIYSYRDYRVGEFATAYKEFPEYQTAIRTKYRSMESGRIAQIMDATHKLVASLDTDERVLFKKRNPDLWVMMNEWAVVEDLAEF